MQILKWEQAYLFRETLRKCYRTLIYWSLSERQMLEIQVQVRSCLFTRKSKPRAVSSSILISHFSFSCVSQEGPGEEPWQLPGVFLFIYFYIYRKCFLTFSIHSCLKLESKISIWSNEPTTLIKLHMRCCGLDNPRHVQDVILNLITWYISDNNSDSKSEII